MGSKGIDKHLIYAQVAFLIVAVFILIYSIMYWNMLIDKPTNFPLDTWHADGPVEIIYEKGILTKDPGTTYTFQTTFKLDKIFHINNPTLFINEGIIPSEVILNGKPLNIKNIAKGHHGYTYNISYTLPPSLLSYENTIKITYVTGDKAGWLSQAYIIPASYADRYIFFHNLLDFLEVKSIIVISLTAFVTLTLVYMYSRYKYIILLAETSFLILIISVLSTPVAEKSSLAYFLPIGIGVFLLLQITHNIKSYITIIIELVIVVIALTFPILISHHQYSYALIRLLLTIPLLIITILHIGKIPSNLLPIIYWLIVFFGSILGESLIQSIIFNKQISTNASLLTSVSSPIVFGLFGLYTETLFAHCEHPINHIHSLIEKQQIFASIFIRSTSLVRNIDTIRTLIVPELCGKDSYTIKDIGVWIVRPDITEDEAILWSSKMIEKLRNKEGIKDIRVGLLIIDPSLNKTINVRRISKETVELAETARYPEFINIKSYP